MSYVTEAVLIDLFGEGELEGLTPEVINNAITAATEETDSYLSERYTVPFDPVPVLIKSLTADIARYRLFGSVGRPYNEDLTADVHKRYENALKKLTLLANGSVKLTTVELSGDLPEFAEPLPSRGWGYF